VKVKTSIHLVRYNPAESKTQGSPASDVEAKGAIDLLEARHFFPLSAGSVIDRRLPPPPSLSLSRSRSVPAYG
jgi:hypothetical protein